ncbi:MAG: protein-disulfide reductase DsbD domain-containing protein, partial [Verrucomicrobiota bacterium]
MCSLSRILKFFAQSLATLCASFVWAQDFTKGPVDTEQVIAELVAEVEAAVPGQEFDVALKLDMDPHWHVYWKNPGDVGQPPSVKWTLPEGVMVGELEFPYPEKIPFGEYVSYGYEDRTLFLATVKLSEDYPIGQTLSLKAEAKWLVCEEMCVPGRANLQLDIPTAAAGETVASTKWLPAIEATRKTIGEIASGGSIEYERTESALKIDLAWDELEGVDLTDVYFFVEQEALVDSAKPQPFLATAKGASVSIPLSEFADEGVPERVAGLLYKESGFDFLNGRKTVAFDSDLGAVAAETSLPPVEGPAEVVAASGGEVTSFGQALLYAFLGGMILNLMPCVFPVLSVKILGFAQQAGQDHSKILKHGLVFGVGVVVSFWALSGLLIGLRAAGEGLGWGFQMQNPYFVGVML